MKISESTSPPKPSNFGNKNNIKQLTSYHVCLASDYFMAACLFLKFV